jgi:hypothetical protein
MNFVKYLCFAKKYIKGGILWISTQIIVRKIIIFLLKI